MTGPPVPRESLQGLLSGGAGAGSHAILQLFAHLPIMVLAAERADPTHVLFWNHECERISGYTAGDIVGRPAAVRLLYPESAYRDSKMAEWSQIEPGTHGFEMTLTARSRKRHRIAWSVLPAEALGLSVQPSLLWSVGQDITALSDSRQQLRARERLLWWVFRHLPHFVALKDGQGHWLMSNPAAAAALGLNERELVGQTNLELAARGHPAAELLHSSAQHEEATWQAGRISSTEETMDDGTGTPRSFEVARVPNYGRQGQRLNMLIVRRETSEQRAAATKLELAGRVLDQSSDGIFVTNADNRITMVNAAFTQSTGYSADEAIGQSPLLLASGLHDAAFFRAMWEELTRTGRWTGEVWNRRKNGEVYPLWMNLSVLQDHASGSVTHYVASFSDLSSRKAAEEQINVLSTQDPITGLPNRSQISMSGALALNQARSSGEQLVVMVIDVDNFKTLNESLTHAAGDQLLREVGQRLVRGAGERAAVGRLSGDEFLVLLPGAYTTADAAHTARALMSSVGEPILLRDMPFSMTVSIGIAMYPGDGDTFDTLFGRADAALYAAKRSGRAAYQFSSATMNRVALERLQIESALRRALDDNALHLEYQPLVDVATRRIVGCEALCRWNDPQRGAIPPSVFIAVAEDSGMIEQLGGWVLKTATQQLRDWHDAGYTDLVMAVNLSARQFQRGVVLQQVQTALQLSGVAPNRLELELTETVLLHEGEGVISTLRQLKSLGVSLAIDDFGTGYSSFSYLRRFKFDKIKIDQSFIRDLIDDPDDAAIVRGIISLGLSLGLDVLAEGVESEAIAQRLQQMRCTYAQGYHYCRPVPPQSLQLRLAAQRDDALPRADDAPTPR